MKQRVSSIRCFGLSLALHVVVIASVVLAAGSQEFHAQPVPIDVEIIESTLIDTGDMKFSSTPADSPPDKALHEKTRPVPAAPAAIPEPESPSPAPSPTPASPIMQAPPQAQPDPAALALSAPSSSPSANMTKATPGVARKGPENTTRKHNDSAESGSYTPPGYRTGEHPSYPPQARRAGWAGVVTLRILVDVSGTPATVTVKTGSGYEVLDNAAVQAVWKWRFSPAKKGGQAIASFHDVRVRFRLEDVQ